MQLLFPRGDQVRRRAPGAVRAQELRRSNLVLAVFSMSVPASESQQPIHVLVVDDVEDILVTMQMLLERPGLNVLTAASAAQAFHLMRTHESARSSRPNWATLARGTTSTRVRSASLTSLA